LRFKCILHGTEINYQQASANTCNVVADTQLGGG